MVLVDAGVDLGSIWGRCGVNFRCPVPIRGGCGVELPKIRTLRWVVARMGRDRARHRGRPPPNCIPSPASGTDRSTTRATTLGRSRAVGPVAGRILYARLAWEGMGGQLHCAAGADRRPGRPATGVAGKHTNTPRDPHPPQHSQNMRRGSSENMLERCSPRYSLRDVAPDKTSKIQEACSTIAPASVLRGNSGRRLPNSAELGQSLGTRGPHRTDVAPSEQVNASVSHAYNAAGPQRHCVDSRAREVWRADLVVARVRG